MKTELARRQSLTDRLEALFRSRPGDWLSMAELAAVGGLGGWRTRCSDLRLRRAMHIEHNGKNGSASRHRFLPQAPLGPSADQYRERTLF